jgi:hypothetical protein
MFAFLLCVTWGMLTLFFLLLVRAGAKPVPVPAPPKARWRKRASLSLLRVHLVREPGCRRIRWERNPSRHRTTLT